MRVVVELFGNLRELAKDQEKRIEMEVAEDTTVGALLTELGVTRGTAWNAAVNGKLTYADDRLSDDTVLTVFPPIAGG
jgi:molybdopterin converting factor small subunit